MEDKNAWAIKGCIREARLRLADPKFASMDWDQDPVVRLVMVLIKLELV